MMDLNMTWAAFALMGFMGAIINAVKWFIIDKDFGKDSIISVLCWTAVFAVGAIFAIIF